MSGRIELNNRFLNHLGVQFVQFIGAPREALLVSLQPVASTFFTSIGKPIKGIILSLTRQILFFSILHTR